jgi:hypothetical protein
VARAKPLDQQPPDRAHPTQADSQESTNDFPGLFLFARPTHANTFFLIPLAEFLL